MLKNITKLGLMYIFFTISFAFAAESNNGVEKPESLSCLQEIERVSYSGNQTDDKVLNCMKGTNEFSSSTAFLCKSTDEEGKKMPSDEFSSYLVYYQRNIDFYKSFLAEKDPAKKRDLSNQIRMNEEEWLILGYRDEVDLQLEVFNSSKVSCSK